MIRQELLFECSPERFFLLYLSEESHAGVTQSEVHIDDQLGSYFTAYDEYCQGQNLEILPFRLIKQSWRSTEEAWEDEQFSTITFQLEPHAVGMKLIFTQTGHPQSLNDALAQGWQDYYWTPMKAYLLK